MLSRVLGPEESSMNKADAGPSLAHWASVQIRKRYPYEMQSHGCVD